jgi:hypothetical protein
MSLDLAAADQAISETRKSLEASGFSVACADNDGVLTISLTAGPDACAECLVPRAVLESIVGRELADRGVQAGGVRVVYPVDLAEHDG